MERQKLKVKVALTTPQIKIDTVFSGVTSDDIVKGMQGEAANHVPFLLRGVVTRMPPLQFAREAVNRYNAAFLKSFQTPDSCDEFLELGVREGFVTILEK